MTEKESNQIRDLIHNGQGTLIERLYQWKELELKEQRKRGDFMWGIFLATMTVLYIGMWASYRPIGNIPSRNPLIDSCTIFHLQKQLNECDSSGVIKIEVIKN